MTMENFRIRSRRSLVWWGRAPQTYSMREGCRSRSPCSDTRPVAVTAFGQAFARYQDPMDAGSPMRTRGLFGFFLLCFLYMGTFYYACSACLLMEQPAFYFILLVMFFMSYCTPLAPSFPFSSPGR